MLEDYNNIDSAPQSQYFWLLAREAATGKIIILGPYAQEDEANRVGFEKLAGNFEVVPLPTRDSGKATKMLKYRRFHQTARLEEAIKRARHKVEE